MEICQGGISVKFWSIKQSEDGSVDIRIDGDIIDDNDVFIYEFFGLKGTAPNEFRNELNKFKGKPVNVWIDSYGGSVFAAVSIYNALREHGQITTIIDGKAMSAGFTIALAGDTVKMSMGALAMAHNPLAEPGMANAEDLRRVADVLDKVKDTMLNIYQAKSNLSREKLSEIMSAETYMTAQDAKELGFVDEIYENGPNQVKAKGFNRLAIVNSAQLDMDKIREIMAQKQGKPAPSAEKEPDNGAEMQPVADNPGTEAPKDALKEQRKHFIDIKRKILEV